MHNLVKTLSVILTTCLVVSSCLENTEDHSCKVSTTFEQTITMDCPNLNFMFEPDNFLGILCKNQQKIEHFDYNINSLTQGGISYLQFDHCSLSEDFDSDTFVQVVGAKNVDYLAFNSDKEETMTLSREHFLLFPNLKGLSLEGNGDLDSDLLQNLPNLKVFLMKNNNLKHIPANFFRHMSNLTVIELSGSSITSITLGAFRALRKLYKLSLNDTNLEILPANIFKGLRNLNTLTLIRNNFTDLPKGLLQKAANLQHLELRNNKKQLITLPDYFCGNLYELKTVVLAKSGLQYLPETIFWGSINLTSINLRNNLLDTLPANIFKGLANLQILKLQKNKFTNLPADLYSTNKRLIFVDINPNIIRRLFDSLHEKPNDDDQDDQIFLMEKLQSNARKSTRMNNSEYLTIS